MALLENLALLIALPTEYQTFSDRLDQSDYLRKYSLDPESAWQENYSTQVAAPLRRLMSRAQALGAEVQPEATLQSLHHATVTRDIVVLFTHWKGSTLAVEDRLCDDKAAYLARLEGRPSPATRYLTKRLALGTIGETLSEFIESTSSELEDAHPSGFTVMSEPLTVQTERRDWLDERFAGLLQPGNLLELTGGLYSRPKIAEQVDARFTGILDVAACNSSVLADYLDRIARSRFRTVQFPEVLDPALGCEALEITFDVMNEQGLPYLRSRIQALRFVAATLKQLVQPSQPGVLQRLWRSLWHA